MENPFEPKPKNIQYLFPNCSIQFEKLIQYKINLLDTVLGDVPLLKSAYKYPLYTKDIYTECHKYCFHVVSS